MRLYYEYAMHIYGSSRLLCYVKLFVCCSSTEGTRALFLHQWCLLHKDYDHSETIDALLEVNNEITTLKRYLTIFI